MPGRLCTSDQSREERMQEILDTLEREVETILISTGYQRYIASMSRFHGYIAGSQGGALDIHLDKPRPIRYIGRMDSTYISTWVAPQAVVLPPEHRGSVFTKPWVVELILDLAGYSAAANLVDAVTIEPAAGDGAFLASMACRLIASCERQGRSVMDCQSSLIAYEIDPQSAAHARDTVVATLVALGVGEGDAEDLAQGWIKTGDFLLDAPALPKADFVIGNPPYVRLEDMADTVVAEYRRRYRTMVGRADLYVAFYEAALRGLAPDGVCAFICADRWMFNQYGAELRRLATSGYGVEAVVEMHTADVFENEVSAYPAITIMRRGPQQAAVVASAGPALDTAGSTIIAATLREIRDGGEGISPLRGLRAARVDTWFAETAPWPCTSPERLKLLKRLEAEFYPLESEGTKTKVGIGVATGADEIFITSDPDIVESARLLPLAMAGDTVTGQLLWSGHYLINPWDIHGLVALSRYPRLAAYLERYQEQLRARHVGQHRPKQWYRTIDRVNAALTGKPKLYIPDIKARLNPVLDTGETYPHHNLYVVQSAVWDHEVLGGILLSDIGQFFIECYGVRMRGGYLRFQAQYLRRIRVPRPSDITPRHAEGLADAFRRRDVTTATRVACEVYGIDAIPAEEGYGLA